MLRALDQHLQALDAFLSEIGIEPPEVPRAVLEGDPTVFFAEGCGVDRLVDVDTYAPRFDELIATRPPWVSLTYLGLLEGRLVVGVERPSASAPSARTSVNYSGPEARVLANGWRIVV